MTSRAVQDFNPDEAAEREEALLDEFRRKSRKDAVTALLWGAGLILFHVVLAAVGAISFSDIFHSMLFIIGAVGVVGGAWEGYQAGRLTAEDLNQQLEAQEFSQSLTNVRLTYTKAVLACLIAVGLIELVAGEKDAIEAAGLLKDAVRRGEVWRLLTCATLHVNFIHIWMNSQALLGFGKLIESLTDRAYLTLVFLPSAVCASLFSLVLMPNTTSVGASGGLMGLVGFLAVLGYRRRAIVPAGFFKAILLNIGLIGVVGLVGFAIIDNAAHLGGLSAGVACGCLLIKKSDAADTVRPGRWVKGLGSASLLAVVLISLFSIIMILQK